MLTVVVFVAGALVTAVGLRIQARRRGRSLPDLIRAEHGRWGALCRVTSGGAFLDAGRRRRGKGPRGTLLDKYEARHGDQPFTWPWADVQCTGARRCRDLTGLAGQELTLSLPEGGVTLVAFYATGPAPPGITPCR